MPVSLDHFRNALVNQLPDTVLRLNDCGNGIVVTQSPQQFHGRTVQSVQTQTLSASEDAQAAQGNIEVQVKLLQLIREEYGTATRDHILKTYGLVDAAAKGSADQQSEADATQPLTCRKVEHVLACADAIRFQPNHTGLHSLSNEIVEELGWHLDTVSVISLSSTNRLYRTLLAPFNAIEHTRLDTLSEEKRLPEFIRLYEYFTGTRYFHPSPKDSPPASMLRHQYISRGLAGLAEQIHIFPQENATFLFDALLAGALHLPAHRGDALKGNNLGEVLTVLASQLRSLPPDLRLERFNLLLKEASALPDQTKSNLLATLAGAIGCTTEQGSSEDARVCFDAVLADSATLPTEQRADVLAALTPQLGNLPEKDVLGRFDMLLELTLPWSDVDQSEVLASLAAEIEVLPEALRLDRYDKILQRMELMNGELHGMVLAGLASQISTLSTDVQLGEQRKLEHFDDLLARVGALDADWNGLVLESLALQVSSLPAEVRLDRFQSILQKMERSEENFQGMIVAALASQFYSLDPNDRHAMFDTLLEKTDSYDGDAQKLCLEALIVTMDDVLEDEAFARFNLFRERIARLDPSHHGSMFCTLASRLLNLAESDAVTGFNELLRESQPLSEMDKYWLLFRLAGQISNLSSNDGLDSMAAVLRAGSGLPELTRNALRHKLGREIQHLPENHRLDESGVPTTGIWDDNDQQNAILIPLAEEIPNLPEAEKRKRFEALKEIGELLADDRKKLLMTVLDEHNPDRPISS